MKVKNTSSRPYNIGGALILPDETDEVGDEWSSSIVGISDLEVVEKKLGRPAKTVEITSVTSGESAKTE